MVLAGHVHIDNVTIANDTIFLTTTTPESGIRDEDGYWGYRLIEIVDGEISSYNYKEPKYSIPSYHLKLNYQNNKKAKIENDLESDIKAHVEFVLPLADYVVDYGEIVMQRWNDRFIQLYVEIMVEQNSTKTIKVSKASNDDSRVIKY
jgi:hypothetical protein